MHSESVIVAADFEQTRMAIPSELLGTVKFLEKIHLHKGTTPIAFALVFMDVGLRFSRDNRKQEHKRTDWLRLAF